MVAQPEVQGLGQAAFPAHTRCFQVDLSKVRRDSRGADSRQSYQSLTSTKIYYQVLPTPPHRNKA